jgi:hypothetical protein
VANILETIVPPDTIASNANPEANKISALLTFMLAPSDKKLLIKSLSKIQPPRPVSPRAMARRAHIKVVFLKLSDPVVGVADINSKNEFQI